MALQKNNGSPKGYGQPKKNMRQAMMRPEDEQVFGQAPDEGDMRLTPQEEAPSVYPRQPTMPKGPFGLEDQGVSTGVTGPMNHDRSAVSNPRLSPSPRNYTQRNSGVAGGVDRGAPTQTAGVPNYQQSPLIESVKASWSPDGQVTMDQMAATDGWQQRANQSTQMPGGMAQGDPSRGALAQYGTGNIAGASGIQTGNFMGQLEGFNTNAWGGNAPEGYEADSIKNTMGKLMSRVDVTQPGAVDALLAQPEIAQLFPMARKVEHPNGDLIDFGDGNGPVDVIRGAVAGGSGAAWQWGSNDGGGQSMGGPGGPSAQAYQMGMPGQQPMGMPQDPSMMPEVQDENSAMQFLQWLMQQQQQGQMGQQPQGLV